MSSEYGRLDAFEVTRINPKDTILRLACCDCGLVHEIGLAIEGEEVGIAFLSKRRNTAQLRRNHYGNLHKGVGKWKIVRR